MKQVEILVTIKHTIEVNEKDPQSELHGSLEEMVKECAKRNFNIKTCYPALSVGAVKSVKQEFVESSFDSVFNDI